MLCLLKQSGQGQRTEWGKELGRNAIRGEQQTLHSVIHLLIHSCIQELFIEHPLRARLCVRARRRHGAYNECSGQRKWYGKAPEKMDIS